MHDVIVVGAGLGGLACARDLVRAGKRVLVLDKARGVSGRATTRRYSPELRCDLGAQYFTVRTERLRQLTVGWEQESWLRVWTHGFPLWQGGAVHERPPGHPRYAPTKGMSALGRHLARPLDVVTEALVTSLSRTAPPGTAPPGTGCCWRVHTSAGVVYEAERVLFNLPAPQLNALVHDLPLGEAGAELSQVSFDPTWTLLLPLERDLEVAWKALEVQHPVLSWVSRDHTKRGAGAPPALIVHATSHWSQGHLEDERHDVEAALRAALHEVVGALDTGPPPDTGPGLVHRWRYATPQRLFPRPHHWDPGLKLGWCGDWCVAPRVEGALESGWSLASAVLGQG